MNATTKATGNMVELRAMMGHGRRRTEVRWANSGDHWPGYDERMTLRRGYWVGDGRRHDWVGLRKADVEAEALERRAVDDEGGPDVEWL